MDVNEKWLVENGFKKRKDHTDAKYSCDGVVWTRTFAHEKTSYRGARWRFYCICLQIRKGEWIANFGENCRCNGGECRECASLAVWWAIHAYDVGTRLEIADLCEKRFAQKKAIDGINP